MATLGAIEIWRQGFPSNCQGSVLVYGTLCGLVFWRLSFSVISAHWETLCSLGGYCRQPFTWMLSGKALVIILG